MNDLIVKYNMLAHGVYTHTFLKNAFILVLLMYVKVSAHGQTFTFHKESFKIIIENSFLKISSKTDFRDRSVFKTQQKSGMTLTGYQHKAFFCKLEDKIYKKTGTNLKMNLGSNTYVNYLEGKHKIY